MTETMEQVIIEKDDKDWDGRPDDVCQGCGYHRCCCKLQNLGNNKQPFNYQELLIQISET